MKRRGFLKNSLSLLGCGSLITSSHWWLTKPILSIGLNRSNQDSNTCMFTLKSGNWSDTRLWSCGRLPTSSDIVTLKAGHIVVLDVDGAVQKLIMEGGTIQYVTGVKLAING